MALSTAGWLDADREREGLASSDRRIRRVSGEAALKAFDKAMVRSPSRNRSNERSVPEISRAAITIVPICAAKSPETRTNNIQAGRDCGRNRLTAATRPEKTYSRHRARLR